MKRLDRLKQWAGERMGGEVKTTVSDDFKAMEAEMELRHAGGSSCCGGSGDNSPVRID